MLEMKLAGDILRETKRKTPTLFIKKEHYFEAISSYMRDYNYIEKYDEENEIYIYRLRGYNKISAKFYEMLNKSLEV